VSEPTSDPDRALQQIRASLATDLTMAPTSISTSRSFAHAGTGKQEEVAMARLWRRASSS
jgi:hypothetical protein